MTNFEKLKKMNEAEMAAQFTHWITCVRCPVYKGCRSSDDCYARLYAFLLEEAETNAIE